MFRGVVDWDDVPDSEYIRRREPPSYTASAHSMEQIDAHDVLAELEDQEDVRDLEVEGAMRVGPWGRDPHSKGVEAKSNWVDQDAANEVYGVVDDDIIHDNLVQHDDLDIEAGCNEEGSVPDNVEQRQPRSITTGDMDGISGYSAPYQEEAIDENITRSHRFRHASAATTGSSGIRTFQGVDVSVPDTTVVATKKRSALSSHSQSSIDMPTNVADNSRPVTRIPRVSRVADLPAPSIGELEILEDGSEDNHTTYTTNIRRGKPVSMNSGTLLPLGMSVDAPKTRPVSSVSSASTYNMISGLDLPLLSSISGNISGVGRSSRPTPAMPSIGTLPTFETTTKPQQHTPNKLNVQQSTTRTLLEQPTRDSTTPISRRVANVSTMATQPLLMDSVGSSKPTTKRNTTNLPSINTQPLLMDGVSSSGIATKKNTTNLPSINTQPLLMDGVSSSGVITKKNTTNLPGINTHPLLMDGVSSSKPTTKHNTTNLPSIMTQPLLMDSVGSSRPTTKRNTTNLPGINTQPLLMDDVGSSRPVTKHNTTNLPSIGTHSLLVDGVVSSGVTTKKNTTNLPSMQTQPLMMDSVGNNSLTTKRNTTNLPGMRTTPLLQDDVGVHRPVTKHARSINAHTDNFSLIPIASMEESVVTKKHTTIQPRLVSIASTTQEDGSNSSAKRSMHSKVNGVAGMPSYTLDHQVTMPTMNKNTRPTATVSTVRMGTTPLFPITDGTRANIPTPSVIKPTLGLSSGSLPLIMSDTRPSIPKPSIAKPTIGQMTSPLIPLSEGGNVGTMLRPLARQLLPPLSTRQEGEGVDWHHCDSPGCMKKHPGPKQTSMVATPTPPIQDANNNVPTTGPIAAGVASKVARTSVATPPTESAADVPRPKLRGRLAPVISRQATSNIGDEDGNSEMPRVQPRRVATFSGGENIPIGEDAEPSQPARRREGPRHEGRSGAAGEDNDHRPSIAPRSRNRDISRAEGRSGAAGDDVASNQDTPSARTEARPRREHATERLEEQSGNYRPDTKTRDHPTTNRREGVNEGSRVAHAERTAPTSEREVGIPVNSPVNSPVNRPVRVFSGGN